MSDVIGKLHAEHLRLERVVRLLNTQANLLTGATAPHIALLVDALCYLTRFPDVSHHALEDRMVGRLLGKKALSVEAGREIEEQHARLIRDGRDLLRDLEAATRGENMSQELADLRIRIYAERLRHNMALEELTLFPAASRYLDRDDWNAIEDPDAHAPADPLFGGEVAEQFSALYRVIAAESAGAIVNEPR